MSDNTPRLGLPELVQMQEMDSAQINDALLQLDALGDVALKGLFVNDPPAAPADGDTYVTGGAPTGAWAGNLYKIAYCVDGGWRIFTPFDGLLAHLATTDSFVVYRDGQWTGLGALIAGPEVSFASAATCDLAAAGALNVLVTGTAAIASFGGGANLLRFVRFAQALTLTHDDTSLVLPGGASIATAAGDFACFRSDAAGNWRCVFYSRADGRMANMDSPGFTGDATFLGRIGIGVAPSSRFNIKDDGNGVVSGTVENSDGGIYAGAQWIADNGSHSTYLRILGDGFGSFGVYRAGYGVLQASLGLSLAVDSGPILFGPNGGGEQARFSENGALLLGTTGDWLNGARAQVISDGAHSYGLGTWVTSSGGTARTSRVDHTASFFDKFFYGDSTFVGSITTDGSATAYNTTSDARLKTVMAEQADYRAAIKALWVGDFVWKASGERAFGVLAQQAYAHMPNHQGVSRPQNEEDPWHASAEPFAHLALWGVKDLYALVEALAARIAVLEKAETA